MYGEEGLMAQKRQVANLLALAVLSMVIQRPMHRYEMASVMRARGKDRDMNVKFGSLYTVVQNPGEERVPGGRRDHWAGRPPGAHRVPDYRGGKARTRGLDP